MIGALLIQDSKSVSIPIGKPSTCWLKIANFWGQLSLDKTIELQFWLQVDAKGAAVMWEVAMPKAASWTNNLGLEFLN